jgi:hypothetical protein
VTITALSPSLCSAKLMTPGQKQRAALDALSHRKTITRIADGSNTSRKFIRQQGSKAQTALETVFNVKDACNDDVIYDLPVTKAWISQLVLALMFLGHSSYRNIAMLLKDVLDYDISLGSINAIFNDAVEQARTVNDDEDLSNIAVTANDELFHKNKPILSGVDTRSLYCYLLASEDKRDEDTWAVHLMEAESKGLSPQRTIGDDAKGLVAGHKLVFPQADYHYDIFHLSRALMDLRRYFRNRLKSTITAFIKLQRPSQSTAALEISDTLLLPRKEMYRIRHISMTLDTLISWLEHDIFNKAGPTPEERRELYDFVVDEFKKLECIEAHRITSVRTTLENKREMALGFSDVLAEKFMLLSKQFTLPIKTIWAMCKLQRCGYSSDQYYFRSRPLESELEGRFDEVEDAVLEAMDSTERTSSMVENLNGRVRGHIEIRREIGHGYLDLLRFILNHKPLVRSARSERKGKTPAEILSGKTHLHWLELLGFERFQRAA